MQLAGEIFYLITDWSVTSHIYVKTSPKTIFSVVLSKFSVYWKLHRKIVFLSHILENHVKKFWAIFFILVKPLFIKLETKARFYSSFNLVLDFLKIKNAFFCIFSWNFHSKAKDRNFKNKFGKTQVYFCRQDLILHFETSFIQIELFFLRWNIWNEKNHQKKIRSKMHLKIGYLLRKNLLRSHSWHPHHEAFSS